jgi:hypothetical protein
MPQKNQPATKMYEVFWERDGRLVCRVYVDAASEPDAISEAESFLTDNPRLDRRANASAHVRILPIRLRIAS